MFELETALADSLHLRGIMADPEHGGLMPPAIIPNHVFGRPACCRIQTGGRFIEQQDLRLLYQYPQQRQTLSLTGRQTTDGALQETLIEPQRPALLGSGCDAEVPDDIIEPPLAFSGDIAHTTTPFGSAEMPKVDSVQGYLVVIVCRWVEIGNRAQQAGFTTTGSTADHYALPTDKGQRDRLQVSDR